MDSYYIIAGVVIFLAVLFWAWTLSKMADRGDDDE
jgi:hypothetical protein